MIKPGDILSVLEKPMGRAVFTVARVLLIGIQTGTIHTFASRYIETVGTLLHNLATLSSMHSTVRYTRYISRQLHIVTMRNMSALFCRGLRSKVRLLG